MIGKRYIKRVPGYEPTNSNSETFQALQSNIMNVCFPAKADIREYIENSKGSLLDIV